MTTHEYLLNKYGATLTFEQASEATGIYWQTIRVMCLRGDIKTPRAGRKWVLTAKALAEFLDGHTNNLTNGDSRIGDVTPIRTRVKHEKIV